MLPPSFTESVFFTIPTTYTVEKVKQTALNFIEDFPSELFTSFLFGVTEKEPIYVEFVRFATCHPKIEQTYLLGQTVTLYLLLHVDSDKTRDIESKPIRKKDSAPSSPVETRHVRSPTTRRRAPMRSSTSSNALRRAVHQKSDGSPPMDKKHKSEFQLSKSFESDSSLMRLVDNNTEKSSENDETMNEKSDFEINNSEDTEDYRTLDVPLNKSTEELVAPSVCSTEAEDSSVEERKDETPIENEIPTGVPNESEIPRESEIVPTETVDEDKNTKKTEGSDEGSLSPSFIKTRNRNRSEARSNVLGKGPLLKEKIDKEFSVEVEKSSQSTFNVSVPLDSKVYIFF